jgi:hypothetical protein
VEQVLWLPQAAESKGRQNEFLSEKNFIFLPQKILSYREK